MPLPLFFKGVALNSKYQDSINSAIVRMEGITKTFGGLTALDNVDFVLRESEILGLVGDNAAGKSTLMKILIGAYSTTKGQIYYRGEPVQIDNPHDAHDLGIEIIYQNLALCDNLGVAENVLLGRWPRKWGLFVDSAAMKNKTHSVLDRMGISIQSLDQEVATLSGGKRQTVAVARAISFDPDVLIMDEPTANLSPEASDHVLSLAQSLREQGVSIIIITHRLSEIFGVTDRISVLRRGKLVGTVTTSEVTEDDVLELIISGKRRRKTE